MGLFERVSLKTVMDTPSNISRYTAEEYEFLFMLIKNSTFKGEHLEFVYNLTLKLQEDYLAVKNIKE